MPRVISSAFSVIGPTRLNYARDDSTVDYAARIVSRMLGGDLPDAGLVTLDFSALKARYPASNPPFIPRLFSRRQSMTDPDRQKDDPVNPEQASEPCFPSPTSCPDIPEQGSVEALAKEAAESRDKMLRTLANGELRKRSHARALPMPRGLWHLRLRPRHSRYRR